MTPVEILFAVIGVGMSAAGAGAAGAWRGSKAALNGMGATVVRIENKLDVLEEQVQENRNSITGIRAQCVFHERRQNPR